MTFLYNGRKYPIFENNEFELITCIQHDGFNMAVILIKIIKNISVLQIKLINTPYKSKNWKKYGQ